MNYKIIHYRCNHKFIYITEESKRILINHSVCPECGAPKIKVILFCQDCGLKITEIGLLAWQRKKRCLECVKADQKKRTKENWRKKAKKYNIKRRGKIVKDIDYFAMKKQGALRRLYRSMDRALPIVETPILDRYTGGNNV